LIFFLPQDQFSHKHANAQENIEETNSSQKLPILTFFECFMGKVVPEESICTVMKTC